MRSNTAFTSANGRVSMMQRNSPSAAIFNTARMSSRVPTDEPIEAVYASNLIRSQQTAETLALPTTDSTPSGRRHFRAVS